MAGGHRGARQSLSGRDVTLEQVVLACPVSTSLNRSHVFINQSLEVSWFGMLGEFRSVVRGILSVIGVLESIINYTV